MTRAIILAAAIALCAALLPACRDHSPTYRERILNEIAERHGSGLSRHVRAMPFMQTPHSGADLPLLHAVLRAGQLPMSDIEDEDTWRAAAAHLFPHWKRTTDPRLWNLETRRLGKHGVSVGVLHQKSLPAQVPWDAIAAALDRSAELAGVPIPEHAGNSVLIVYGAPVPRQSQATTYGSHIAIRSVYRNQVRAAAWILSHEISHQWWYANAPYIDEGIAELTAHLANRQRERPALTAAPCNQTTLQSGESRPPDLCDYHLGGDLFLDLMRHDPQRFKTSLSNLLRLTPGASLSELKQAFRHAEQRAIIDRYFDAASP